MQFLMMRVHASTGTFLNREIAIALGLQSAYERVTVRVLKETVESFDTMPVKVTLESVDGQTSMALNVYTCPGNVTGSNQAVNWNLYKDQWSYLSSIKFPKPAKEPIVDILIRVEYSFLHSSTVDLSGEDPKGPVQGLDHWGGLPVSEVQTVPKDFATREQVSCPHFSCAERV